jgi:hypothetical protein
MPEWLEPMLSTAALAGVIATVIYSALGWRSQRRQLESIQGEFSRLHHLRTTVQQRRSEVAAEALGATIRFGVVLKRAGEVPTSFGASTPGDRGAAALYLRDALEKSWLDIGPIERRFEQAWDQALVYLDDDRVTDLMERLWRLKETRHKEQQSSLADGMEESDGRGSGSSPGLLEGPEFERYIQFVEAVDDIVREAKEIVRPLVRQIPSPAEAVSP